MKSKANLAVISTLLFALIPRMDKDIKRQMLSLISVVMSSMFVLMPFAPAVSDAGPVSYTINKTVIDVAGEGPAGNVTKAGDIISYQVDIANDGNLNFTNVNVTDSLIKLTGPIESNSNDSILETGENWTYTGNYTVTQGDINNNGTIGDGFIVNNATVNCDNIGLQNDSVQVTIE